MSFFECVKYVKFNPTTGEIIAWGQMQNGAIIHLRLLGESYIVGDGHPSTHYVDPITETIILKETILETNQ
jgi:hypothetical protein